MTPMSNRIFTRSLLGALLVMFLMPFTTLTCGGVKLITLNGVQLATGTTVARNDPFSGQSKEEHIKPEPLAAIAVIIAVVALGLAFLVGNGWKLTSAIASSACALSLLVMKLKIDQDAITQGQGLLSVQWEFGFWIALLTSAGAAVLSFIPNKLDAGEC